LGLCAFFSSGAKHAFGIEFKRNLSPAVYGDEASLARERGEFLEYHLACRRADAAAAISHTRTDIVRNRAA
jgi:hypothetical protein